jgi:hypothetical protein
LAKRKQGRETESSEQVDLMFYKTTKHVFEIKPADPLCFVF